MKKGKELEEYLNNSFSELTTEFNLKENLFFIKFEKIYSSLLFTESKKKYAGMLAWKEGHKQKKPVLSIVGFEFKRSDSPLITHEIQQKVLGLILSGKDQKIVCKYLDDVKNTMDSRSVEELGIPKPITKDFSKYHSNAIHKHAAEWSNKNLNTRFCPGSKGIMLFIKKFPKSLPQPEGNVIMFESDQELPEGFEIDSKKIFEKYVDNKVASLFDAVGWLRDANQTRLGEF
jgi:DNA polymerase I